MSQAPAMPIFTDALIGDTTHLSRDEFGAYCLLLFATWRNNGEPFADDDERLSRIARSSEKDWRKLRPILVNFFDLSDGFWRQKRLEKEWKRTQILITDRREKGKLGAQRRWNTNQLENNETEIAHANGSGNALGNASGNGQGNGWGNGSGYGNQTHTHNIPPISPKGDTIGDEHLRPPATPARALGYERRSRRKPADDPYQLAALSADELGRRFNDKSRPRDERLAIRKILMPNAYPPEPGTFN